MKLILSLAFSGFLLIFISGCYPNVGKIKKELVEAEKNNGEKKVLDKNEEELKRVKKLNQKKELKADSPKITIIYRTKSSYTTVTLDPYEEGLSLDLSGSPETTGVSAFLSPPPEVTINEEKEMSENRDERGNRRNEKEDKEPQKSSRGEKENKSEANYEEKKSESFGSAEIVETTDKVLHTFRKSQDFFYQKDYDKALEMINKSINTMETAEAYALKGSIYFMKGQNNIAKTNWQKALGINPDMPNVSDMIKKLNSVQ